MGTRESATAFAHRLLGGKEWCHLVEELIRHPCIYQRASPEARAAAHAVLRARRLFVPATLTWFSIQN